MKFALATTVLVSTMVSTLSMNYDVNIFPKCKGVDFDDLSDNENEFVAETLENSYNQLHQLWDGGDKYLFGIESASAAPELGEGLGETKLRQGGGYNGGGSCGNYCSNEDGCIDDSYSWAYDDAVLCANNDAILAVTKQTKSKVDRLWEKSFQQKLKESPYPVFANVGKCDLTMLTQEAPEPPVKGAGGGAVSEVKSANIFVSCKEGSFANLDVDTIDFLAYVLSMSFSKANADESLMLNVAWNEAISTGNGGMGWTADVLDMGKKINLRGRGKDNKAWADSFVFGLKNSPFPALKDLDKCKITSLFSEKAFTKAAPETFEEA